MSDVGTKQVFENERVRVWEMTLEPGELTGLHTHAHEYFFHVLEGSTLETFKEDGESIGAMEFATGKTFYFELDGDELVIGPVRAPARHDAKNVGPGRYREILVELKP